ncbi:MAG: DUF488 family protein [Nitrososphaera sp.]|nr:DUF488 family protein [Nitrososphaera sp.]
MKRIYERPAKTDGPRILVGRLWPRGVTKAKAHIILWEKDLAPSNELRSWFHRDPENRFADLTRRYTTELEKNKQTIKNVVAQYEGSFTPVTAVKDIEHSHIPTLKSVLESGTHVVKPHKVRPPKIAKDVV